MKNLLRDKATGLLAPAAAVASVAVLAGMAVSHASAGGDRAAALALACISTAAAAWSIVDARRRAGRSLRAAGEGARRMTEGDLSQAVPVDGAGDRELLLALETMREQTFRVVSDVRARTLAIATSSGHIGSDQAAFASMVRTQADALDATASSLEQMTAAVEHSAENATRGRQKAAEAVQLATDGGRAVQQVVDTMGTIRQSSAKIVDIISVIDGIAFQTNILALNAAVEAARAGEQGRGFAVVASEVRSLATRSAEAAREVKSLIQGSVQAVETGAGLVDQAGSTISQVVQGVEEVAGIISEMSTASREQSAGIAEINRAMAELDSATKRNASVIERAADPVKALHQQAVGLTEAVSFFKLGEREHASMEEAVQLVRHAVQFARQHGNQALVDDVNRLDKGRFLDRDLYLSLYSADAQCVAHGVNARLVGVDGRHFKDVEGKIFVAEICRVAKAEGRGTVAYTWLHPLTQKALRKSTYFEKVGDLVISCGAYAQAA